MSEPCDALAAEIALDRVEAELARELPEHMRAFARAHAEGRRPPAAPPVARLPSTLGAARNACMHDVLVERGVALLRLVVPLVIESDPAVVAARSALPTWPGLVTLAAARDAVARRQFGRGAIELLHRLHGCEALRGPTAPAPPSLGSAIDGGHTQGVALGSAIDGWHARGVALDDRAIGDTWAAIAGQLGVHGQMRIERSARAHPRAFSIEPQREVVVVVPDVIDTPATRFAVLHELGHAVVALALPAGTPRVVDEAAAAYVARLMESPSWLPACWTSELAPSARRRRLAIARTLDAVERALPQFADVPAATPPWALWHDPGAQAAYVEAEQLADHWARELDQTPGRLVNMIELQRTRIDLRTRV